MSELHPVLEAAVAATGPRLLEYRPRFPPPAPRLAPEELARLGLWCARWVEAAVPAAARAEFTEVLEHAEGFVTDRAAARGRPFPRGHGRLRVEHLSIARLASAAARRAATNPAATRVALCAAVKLVVRLERAAARQDRVAGELRFLLCLDEELVRLEAEAAVREHVGDSAPAVDAVLWRRAQAGEVRYWLLRLEAPEPRYGLLARQRGRWRWLEGPRDDALSTVPDELFAEAVQTCLERDAYRARPRPVTR